MSLPIVANISYKYFQLAINMNSFRSILIVIQLWLLTIQSFPTIDYQFQVPNVVRPVVPDAVKQSLEYLNHLQQSLQDPEVKPGLFQGDMAMSNEHFNHWRVGLRWDVFPDKLWENRTIPYVISPLYSTVDYITIYKAISNINYMTCVNFVPWDEVARDFLLIWPIKYPAGCWSFVGKFGGTQLLSLQPPDVNGPNCLGDEGRAIHELMHALGIFHEQSRADRDTYVKVHELNILPEYLTNFDKQSLENTTYSYEYDYESIMHYGSHYFSVSVDKPTLMPTMPGATFGQRKGMSKTDCLKINDLYGCLQNLSEARRWYNICAALALGSRSRRKKTKFISWTTASTQQLIMNYS